MDNLVIDTGLRRLKVTRDGKEVGEVSYNPTDYIFAEKYYAIFAFFEQKQKEYEGRMAEMDASTEKDSFGFPANTPERLKLAEQICNDINEKIDEIFGENTSKIVFGDFKKLELYPQFFSSIAPDVQKARAQKVEKYITPKPRKRSKK
jgi:hypothetical protein